VSHDDTGNYVKKSIEKSVNALVCLVLALYLSIFCICPLCPTLETPGAFEIKNK
jgi:hypothetical protein